MWPALQTFRARDAIDILVVAIVLYRIFVMFKETRAVQMLVALALLFIFYRGAQWARLELVAWLLTTMLPYLATIAVLALISRNPAWIRINMPASLGKPFVPGS